MNSAVDPSNLDPRHRSALLPGDHPDRMQLAWEVHARPPEALTTPSRATYVAVLVDSESREQELRQLEELCREFGVAGPAAGASHHSANLGELLIKWERHGEFSGYTFVATGIGRTPFCDPPAAHLPTGWLAAVPGRTIFAANSELIPSRDAGDASAQVLGAYFGENVAIGSIVGGGAGCVYTDFRIHPDGFARFLLIDRSFTSRQVGRMMQRLFEIEAYRMLALLALPIAREQWPRISELERSLLALITGISREDGDDETTLHQLTRLAKEIESCIVSTQFRFGACAAYHELVTTRIGELREQRLEGVPTIEEFMTRRFSPAVATVANASRRLNDLSNRVAQACALLATRVGIAREKQNQALLESMNRRARQQLRLQQTVESLSLAAILYYLAGLVGYLSKGLKANGYRIDPDVVVGVAILPLALVLVYTLRKMKRSSRDDVLEGAVLVGRVGIEPTTKGL